MVCALDPAGYPQHLQHLPLFSIFCQPSSALAGLVGFCVLFKIFQYFLTSLVAQLNQVESLFKHQQFHRLMTSAPNSVVVLNCSKQASERERENSECFIVEGHLTHYKQRIRTKQNKQDAILKQEKQQIGKKLKNIEQTRKKKKKKKKERNWRKLKTKKRNKKLFWWFEVDSGGFWWFPVLSSTPGAAIAGSEKRGKDRRRWARRGKSQEVSKEGQNASTQLCLVSNMRLYRHGKHSVLSFHMWW